MLTLGIILTTLCTSINVGCTGRQNTHNSDFQSNNFVFNPNNLPAGRIKRPREIIGIIDTIGPSVYLSSNNSYDEFTSYRIVSGKQVYWALSDGVPIPGASVGAIISVDLMPQHPEDEFGLVIPSEDWKRIIKNPNVISSYKIIDEGNFYYARPD